MEKKLSFDMTDWTTDTHSVDCVFSLDLLLAEGPSNAAQETLWGPDWIIDITDHTWQNKLRPNLKELHVEKGGYCWVSSETVKKYERLLK